MGMKEVVGQPIFKLDENNKVLEGTLLEIQQGVYGPQFRIKTAAGEEVVLGNQTVLETKITARLVGKRIRVQWLGPQKSKKSRYSYIDYKVFEEE